MAKVHVIGGCIEGSAEGSWEKTAHYTIDLGKNSIIGWGRGFHSLCSKPHMAYVTIPLTQLKLRWDHTGSIINVALSVCVVWSVWWRGLTVLWKLSSPDFYTAPMNKTMKLAVFFTSVMQAIGWQTIFALLRVVLPCQCWSLHYIKSAKIFMIIKLWLGWWLWLRSAAFA